jgi:hypothetical protein
MRAHLTHLLIVLSFLCSSGAPSRSAPVLQRADQSTEYLVVSGLPAGASASINVNGSALTNSTVDSLQVDWALSTNTSGAAAGDPNFGNLLDPAIQVWVGGFEAASQQQILFHNNNDGNWWISSDISSSGRATWKKAANTSGFGSLLDGKHLTWIGDFTGAGQSEVLFNDAEDGNWWLGQMDAAGKLNWSNVGNTLNGGSGAPVFGDLSGNYIVRMAAVSGNKTGVLLYSSIDGNWWRGALSSGPSLQWTHLGNTSGVGAGAPNFGNLNDKGHLVWAADFTGSGEASVLFYYEGDGNWFLGSIDPTGTLQWTRVGNTKGVSIAGQPLTNFGNLLDGNHTIWAGDFVTQGKASIAFNYRIDGNWFIGTVNAGVLSWLSAGNTKGFGDITDPGHQIQIGHFGGGPLSEIVFYYNGDGNWWRGSLQNQSLVWNLAGNTRNFGNLLDSSHKFFQNDQSSSSASNVVFYYSGDGNWWLGQFDKSRLKLPEPLSPGDVVTVTGVSGVSAFSTNSISVDHNYATEHFDRQRSGWDHWEPTLDRKSVQSLHLLATLPSDNSYVYTQPLLVQSVAIAGSVRPRDVLYFANEQGTIFAYDANSFELLSKRPLIPVGEQPVPSTDIYKPPNLNIYPTIAITGTPVIDRADNSIFVVVKSRENASGQAIYHQRLFKLSLSDLSVEGPTSPVEISVPHPTGLPFDPLANSQRAALLLSNGIVYVAFASHEDRADPINNVFWSGWIMAYDETTLDQVGVYDADQNQGAGIWQSGAGPAADSEGNVFFATGNVLPTAPSPNRSNSVIKVGPGASSSLDFFTPSTQRDLNNSDWDLGSGGVILLPMQTSSPHNLLVAGGKQGYIYTLDRDNLGQTQTSPDANALELYPPNLSRVAGNPAGSDGSTIGVYGVPAYFGGSRAQQVFICGAAGSPPQFGQLVAFTLVNSQLIPGTTTSAQYGACSPSVTSAGTDDSSGVIWILKRSNPLELYALSTDNPNDVLLSVDAGPWALPAKTPSGINEGSAFVEATVINGRVYVPNSSGVSVLGQ